MPADYRATDDDTVSLRVGETVTLESLRQAVVPPYVMLIPFLVTPPGVELVRQDPLEEDGVHGCVYAIRGLQSGTGVARVGFKDLRSGEVTHERRLTMIVQPPLDVA